MNINPNIIISCKNCGQNIDVENAIRERIYAEITQEHSQKFLALKQAQENLKNVKKKARKEYSYRLEEDRKKCVRRRNKKFIKNKQKNSRLKMIKLKL